MKAYQSGDSQILELKNLINSDIFDADRLIGENTDSEEGGAIYRLLYGIQHFHTTIMKMVSMGKVYTEMNVVRLVNEKLDALKLLGIVEASHQNVNSLRLFIEAIETKFNFSIEESGFCLNIHEHLDDTEVAQLAEDLFEIFIQKRAEWSVDFYVSYIVAHAESLSNDLGVEQTALFTLEIERAIEEAHSRLPGMPFGEWITYITIEGSAKDILDQIVVDGNAALPENFVLLEVPVIDVFGKLATR